MTVSKASLLRNNMQYVSADARADREGFIPPSRDWTRPPGTTPPTTTPSPAPSLPPPTDVRDSSSRLAIGFPKLRRAQEEEEEEEEGDSKPIIKEDSADIALQCQ